MPPSPATSTNGYRHLSYSFTPDGETVVSGGGNGVLTAYDRAGNKLGDFVGHEGDVWAVAPSPDGRFLVSGSADQTVRLWNLKTRELLVTLFRGADGEWVMWTPEGFYTGSPGADKHRGLADQPGAGQGSPLRHRRAVAQSLAPARSRRGQDRRAIRQGLVKDAAAKLDIEELIRKSLAPEVAILSPQDGAFGKEFARAAAPACGSRSQPGSRTAAAASAGFPSG